MTSNSVWDDPELRAGGEYVKFDNIGDAISGTITAVRAHRWDDGSVSPQILLTDDDGEDRTLTASQIRLKLALAEQRPEAGDHLRVALVNIEKRASGKTLKHFDVQVTRGGAPAAPAAPAAAADALAALTPAQRAALGL